MLEEMAGFKLYVILHTRNKEMPKKAHVYM